MTAAATTRTILATVSKVNERGLQIREQPGAWFNISQYAKGTPPTIPPIGTEIALTTDARGFIVAIKPQEETGSAPTPIRPMLTSSPATTPAATGGKKDMLNQAEPTVTVSMARKVNMGNYESADCFVSISGVRAGMTAEELAPLMDTGKVAWDLVRAALVEQVKITMSKSVDRT